MQQTPSAGQQVSTTGSLVRGTDRKGQSVSIYVQLGTMVMFETRSVIGNWALLEGTHVIDRRPLFFSGLDPTRHLFVLPNFVDSPGESGRMLRWRGSGKHNSTWHMSS